MLNKILIMVLATIFSMSLQAESLSATLAWADKYTATFPVNGIVEKVTVLLGDKVQQGQLLAKLEQAPFEYQIKKTQAKVAQLQPRIFDARLELDRANELFDRAVLSEIELQKIDTIYKGLLAEENAAKADLLLAQWRKEKSNLKAKSAARVIAKNIQAGKVVSQYNQGTLFLELASLNNMLASAKLSIDAAISLTEKTIFKVVFNDKQYNATRYSLSMQPDAQGEYLLQVKFNVPETLNLLAGAAVEINYQ